MRWRVLPYHAVKPKNVRNAWSVSQLNRGVRWKRKGQKLSLQSVTLLPDTRQCATTQGQQMHTAMPNREDKLWVQTAPTGSHFWLPSYCTTGEWMILFSGIFVFIDRICSIEWSHLWVSGNVHLGLQRQRGRQGAAHWLREKNINVLTQRQQTAGMEIQKEILLDRLKGNGSVLVKSDNGFILIMQADWKAENKVSDVSDDERGYQWRDQVNLKSCLIALTKVQNRVKRWNERGSGALNDVWAVKSMFIEENGGRLWATSTEGTVTLWRAYWYFDENWKEFEELHYFSIVRQTLYIFS